MDQTKIAGPTRRLDLAARLQLANRLFREYYTACFWHLKPDLTITEETLPLVIKGLRTHGGRAGMLATAELLGE